MRSNAINTIWFVLTYHERNLLRSRSAVKSGLKVTILYVFATYHNFDRMQVSSVTMSPQGAFICNNICKYTPLRDSIRRVNGPFAVIPQERCILWDRHVDRVWSARPRSIMICTREILSHCTDFFFTGILRPHRMYVTYARICTQQDIASNYKRREASIVKLRLCKSAITKTIRFSATPPLSTSCTVEREMTMQ